MKRRSFIRKSALLLAAAAVEPVWARNLSDPKKNGLLGIQLYTVREEMTKDPLGTLRSLSQMGYRHVEHASYYNRRFYGYPAQEFKKLLADLGMSMPSGHTVMRASHWDKIKKDFTDEWKFTVEDAAIAGQSYVISPSLEDKTRKDKNSLLEFMDLFNKSGELCKQSGMRFGYHNHDFEFNEFLDGESVYDLILRHTNPDLVVQQLDTGNLFNGGVTAMDIVKKYPGRFLSLHVKDAIASAGNPVHYESCVLGKGVADVKEVIRLAARNIPDMHYIIEQEAYQGISPLECAKQNLQVMKSWGYK